MNKRQKEVQNVIAKREKQVIKELKEAYQKALADIDSKISELLSRTDIENLQSIIYQVDYQRALRGQISGFLDLLQSESFDSISRYLTECYENGWIGTLYDLQGQNIPLLFRINQKQVIAAIETNSKLSKKLYDKLGVDIDELKKSIQAELSRGISQAYSHQQIARNLKNAANITFNRATVIARTEGHRITQEATFNCQVEAKKKGCQIMKTWDSTLDMRTRPTHQYLDGQTVDVETPFVNVNGKEAMFPGDFEIAREDINCRCCMLQRAKWALTDEEFTKYNGESRELQHFESIKDYEEFKQEFWKWEGSSE